MSDNLTPVSLGGYTINIQNSHYNYLGAIQINPKAALAMVGISTLATTVISSTCVVLSTDFINDGPLGFAISGGAGLALQKYSKV